MELSKATVQMTRKAFRTGLYQARQIEQESRFDANRQPAVVDAFRPFFTARRYVNDAFDERDAARDEADALRYPHMFAPSQIAAD